MQLIVDSLLTTYKRQGKGKLILLLHGWGDSLQTFQSLQTSLSQEYETISVDLPGFGKTEPPKTVWKLDDYAAFVQHFLEKLELHDLFAIVAHSNGAALVIRGTAEKVLQPKKLVLLGSAGIRNKQSIRRIVFMGIAKVGKVVTFWLPKSLRQRLQRAFYGTIGSDLFVAPHLQETFKLTVRQDVQVDARKLDMPVLLIYGQQDTATPPQDGERFQTLIPGSVLKIVPDAQHFVHHDAAQQVTAYIQEFLR